jgi:hypothetical protein
MLLLSSVDVVPYSVYSLGLVAASVCKYLGLAIHQLTTSQYGHYRGRSPGGDAYRCDQADRLAR